MTMSLDRRLRDELRQEADAIEPDVERHLGAVEAGARRRSGLGASTLLVAAAIVVAAIILRFPGGFGSGPAGLPSSSVAPSIGVSAASPSTPASYPQIAGTYTATLDPSDVTVKKDGVGGTWTMRLEPTGAVLLSPPASFAPGANGLSGVAFSLDADRFRTSLFYNDYCSSVGNYVWNLAAGALTFTSVDDTCSIRKTLMTTTPWLASK
jgi:hypothetical protein